MGGVGKHLDDTHAANVLAAGDDAHVTNLEL